MATQTSANNQITVLSASWNNASTAYTAFKLDVNNILTPPTSALFDIGTNTGTYVSRFFINVSGSVGIGTASPGYALHVAGSTSGFINPATPADLTPTHQLYIGGVYKPAYIKASPRDWYGNNYYLDIATQASSTSLKTYIRFLTEDLERVRIDGSGNVGIGTTDTNGNRLAISGGNLSVTGSVLPGVDGAYDLGNASYRWANIRGVNIYGTLLPTNLTQGSVLFISNTGAIAQNNSNFFWDNTNSRVGIGTSSPQLNLHLATTAGGTVDAPRILFTNGTTGHTTSDGSFIGIANGNNLSIWNSESSIVNFATSGSERMRISSGGNVGIGGTNPLSRFEVTGSGATSSTSTMHLLNSSGNSLLYVRDDKRVGVGTPYPLGLLTIGNPSADGTSDYTKGIVFADTLAGDVVPWTHAAIWSLGSTGFNGSLLFGTDGDGTSGASVTERMRIDNNGNIGIGTTSYTARLYVSGSSTASTSTMIVREGVVSPTGGALTFEVENSAGATLFSVSGSGNVGVGTSNASGKFEVVGTSGSLMLVTDSLSGSLFSVNDVTGLPILEVFSDDKVVAGRVNSNALVVTGSQVGIGTAGPSANMALTIYGGSTAGNIIVGNAFNSSYNGITFNGSGQSITDYNIISSATDKNLFINRPSGYAIRFREANNDQVYIATGGNVGIGTGTILAKLHVNGTARITDYTAIGPNLDPTVKLYVTSPDASASNYSGLFTDNSGIQIAAFMNDKSVRFANNAVRIEGSTGNVGIGTTTNLTAKLTVSSSNSSAIDVQVGRLYAVNNNNTGSINFVAPPGVGTRGTHDYGSIVVKGNSPSGVDDGGSAVFDLKVGGASSANSDIGVFMRAEAISGASNGPDMVSIFSKSARGLVVSGSSAYVGIGTTIPSDTLHVYKNVAFEDLSVRFQSAGSSTATLMYLIGASPSNNSIKSYSTVFDEHWYIGGDGASNTLVFKTAMTEGIRINSTQQVGIGTNNPSGKLHVNGGTFQVDNGTNNRLIALSDGNIELSRSGGSAYIDLKALSSSDYDTRIMSVGSGASAALAFSTVTAGESMRITSSGNVGIGTNNPTDRLHVYKNTASTDLNVYFQNAAASAATLLNLGGALSSFNAIKSLDNALNNQNWYIGGLGVANSLSFQTSTTTAMTIDSSQRVGIGTTNPSAYGRLSVAGTLPDIFVYPVGNGGYLRLAANTTQGFIATNQYYDNVSATVKAATTGYSPQVEMFMTDGSIRFSTSTSVSTGTNIATTEVMRVTNGAAVGIGTTGVSARLHVYTTADEVSRFQSAGNPYISLYSGAGAGTRQGYFYSDGTAVQLVSEASKQLQVRSATSLALQTNGSTSTSIFLIDTSGNVGIGTNSPNSRLDVSKSSGPVDIRLSNGGTAYMNLYAGSGVGALTMLAVQNEPLVLGTNNAEKMRILSNAAATVGIGTASPLSSAGVGWVTMDGSAGSIVSLKYNGAEKLRVDGSYSTQGAITSIGASTTLNLQQNFLDVIVIDANQRVAVGGILAADAELHVANSSTTVDTLKLSNGTFSTAGNRIRFSRGGTVNQDWSVGQDTGKNFLIEDVSASAVRLFISGTNGNIGIGTNNPTSSSRFEVSSSLTGNAGSNVRIGLQSGGVSANIFKAYITTFQLPSGDVETVRIDQSGNVGIGTNGPAARLHVGGGNIRVDNGYGIDFSATTPDGTTVSSELLDDYEEGTWSPRMNGDGGSAPDGTTTVNWATYTRVGRLVTINCYITQATVGSRTGNWIIQNLPFANSGLSNYTSVSVGYFSSLNSNVVFIAGTVQDNGSTNILMRGTTVANTGSGNLAYTTYVKVGTEIIITATYTIG